MSSTPMTPDFEVKLLLNPSTVLDPTTSRPLPAFLSLFSTDPPTSPTPIQMTVGFLDTDKTPEIYQAGWSPRIRRMKDEPKKIELTYKKRYPIPLDGPIPGSPLTTYNADPNTPISVLSTAIDSVLAEAAANGFDASESGDYDAQVEWGYAKLTLSISKKKKEKAGDWDIPVPGPGYPGPIELPDEETCRQMLVKNAPKKFDNWGGVKNWGTDALKRSRIYGPVFAERYEGVWGGLEVDIEIWPIKGAEGSGVEWDNIAEISFKTGDIAQAKDKQGELLAVLKEGGYWKEGDSLKTAYIMERY